MAPPPKPITAKPVAIPGLKIVIIIRVVVVRTDDHRAQQLQMAIYPEGGFRYL